MNKVTNGWEMLKQSWAVLRQDRELMVFPIISSLACALVLVSFALPMIGLEVVREQFVEIKGSSLAVHTSNAVTWVVGFAFYFVNYFVIVFFNTALAACALMRFRGGDPTVTYGLNAAMRRLPQIASWALLAATVGTILRMIEERVSFVGRIMVGLIGMAWTIATYLVVPVLAAEGVGPVDAVKRSVELLRKGWGEGLVGGMGLGLAGFLLMLPALALLFAAIVVGVALESVIGAIVLGLLFVVYCLAQSIVISTLRQNLHYRAVRLRLRRQHSRRFQQRGDRESVPQEGVAQRRGLPTSRSNLRTTAAFEVPVCRFVPSLC